MGASLAPLLWSGREPGLHAPEACVLPAYSSPDVLSNNSSMMLAPAFSAGFRKGGYRQLVCRQGRYSSPRSLCPRRELSRSLSGIPTVVGKPNSFLLSSVGIEPTSTP